LLDCRSTFDLLPHQLHLTFQKLYRRYQAKVCQTQLRLKSNANSQFGPKPLTMVTETSASEKLIKVFAGK
jgi:hypothetical protein